MKKTIAMMITTALLCGGSVFAEEADTNQATEAVVSEQTVSDAQVGDKVNAEQATEEIAQEEVQAVKEERVTRLLSTIGKIDEINDNHFVIVGEEGQRTVELDINADTYLLNGVTGEILTWDMLRAGDSVTAYYSPMLTRSIPPQGQAIALVIGKKEKRGMFVEVQHIISRDSYGVTFLTQNEDMEILIPTDERGQCPNIQERMNLLVWGDAMTLSLPARMTATRSQVLPETFDMRMDKEAGKIWIHGQEAGDIVVKDGSVLVSLSDVTEALGYKTEWHDSGLIVVSKGAESYVMRIGSKDYGKNKMRVQLHDVPQMIGGVTYVPVTVFSQLLGLRIADFS